MARLVDICGVWCISRSVWWDLCFVDAFGCVICDHSPCEVEAWSIVVVRGGWYPVLVVFLCRPVHHQDVSVVELDVGDRGCLCVFGSDLE